MVSGDDRRDESAAGGPPGDPADAGADDLAAPDGQPDMASPTSGPTLVIGLLATAVVIAAAAAVALLGDGADDGVDPAIAELEERPTLGEAAGSELDEPLPDVDLEPFADGPEVALGDYAGAPLVLNFWATWCPPCVEEMPDLEEVAGDLEGEVAFLGVNIQDDPDRAAELAADLGVTYDLATDRRGDLFEAIGGFGMPTTLFVDAAGDVVYRHTGPVDAAGLRGLVAEHLGVG